MERLDALVPPLRGRGVYLKIDVQGYELEVLAGARESMPDITLIEAELSLVPLYSGGPLYLEVVERLRGHGFELISVEGITEEPESGHMLQLDGVFGRPSAADGDR